MLKEIAELSLREIAQILGIKEATAKTRVHRGRLVLRAGLMKHLGVEGEVEAGHPHQICIDLLQSKMDGMDRGVELPVHETELYGRCSAFIDSLDLTAETCRWVRGGGLPEELRSRLTGEFDRLGR